jgi:CheY-like chemotaxis protein
MKILIVDDDPAILRIIRGMLVGTDHTLIEAVSGLEAIQAIDSAAHAQQTIDAAIIDYELKRGMTGVDVAKHTPLSTARILLTGYDPNIIRPTIENPLKSFLAILGKPIDKQQLLHVLDHVERMKERTRP